ncbi:MAG: hypothetical protein ABI946_05585 [Chthoniobacterales bacterium]
MNPDKLFDYLDGKLPPSEREQLEEKLMSDEHLRREFNVAREIHRGGGVSREIIVPEDPERGGRLGRRIAIVAIALVFANVIGGLSFIAFKNKKSPAARSGEEAVRGQIASSIGAAAEKALPVPTFVPADIKITAPRAEWENVASRVMAAAVAMGGEAQKGLPNEDMMMVLADVPSSREAEFRLAVNTSATISPPPAAALATAAPIDPNQRSIVQVRIAQAAP